MTPAVNWITAAAFALTTTVSTALYADTQIATAIEIDPQTYAVNTSGKRRKLSVGDALYSGETVTTNRNGFALLHFADETEITVGPNSELDIDDIVMANSKRASSFVVSAVTGSFRFVSGRSDKKSYKIETPTATLGIRGTDFLIIITRGDGTRIEVENGKVNFCDNGGCVDVPKGHLVRQECRGKSCQAKVERNPKPGKGIERRSQNNGNGKGRQNGNGGGNGKSDGSNGKGKSDDKGGGSSGSGGKSDSKGGKKK